MADALASSYSSPADDMAAIEALDEGKSLFHWW